MSCKTRSDNEDLSNCIFRETRKQNWNVYIEEKLHRRIAENTGVRELLGGSIFQLSSSKSRFPEGEWLTVNWEATIFLSLQWLEWEQVCEEHWWQTCPPPQPEVVWVEEAEEGELNKASQKRNCSTKQSREYLSAEERSFGFWKF